MDRKSSAGDATTMAAIKIRKPTAANGKMTTAFNIWGNFLMGEVLTNEKIKWRAVTPQVA
jgi:hypothetical protein